MRKRKTYLSIIFVLMCLLLYFLQYYLNSFYRWDCCDFFLGAKKGHTIPSVVVYKSQKTTEQCGFTDTTPTEKGGWKKVGEFHLYLYSAYWDDRMGEGNKFVRILAMSKGAFDQKTFCRIWGHSSDSYASEIESQELWVSSWDMAEPHQYYRPLLLSCRVGDEPPSAVSVMSEVCQKSDNILSLSTERKVSLEDFVVCLKPLNFKEDVTARLVEWLEFQYLLGADKVAAYVYNLSSQALQVLKGYEKLGKVILKYPTLLSEDGDARRTSEQRVWQKRRYEMMIYNDCFYNHINSHKFVVNLDMDEAIVPKKEDSWMALLKHASKQNPRLYKFASIAAANVYFFESFGSEFSGSESRYLYMLRHLYRSANFTPPGFAQKSFFLTNSTLVATNHYALRTLYSNIGTSTALGKDLAQLHHYRSSCPPKMEKECDENYLKYKVRDPTILKFKKRLIKSIKSKIREFNLTILNGKNKENS